MDLLSNRHVDACKTEQLTLPEPPVVSGGAHLCSSICGCVHFACSSHQGIRTKCQACGLCKPVIVQSVYLTSCVLQAFAFPYLEIHAMKWVFGALCVTSSMVLHNSLPLP